MMPTCLLWGPERGAASRRRRFLWPSPARRPTARVVAFGGGRAARFADAAWSELALDGAAAAASRRLAACVCATARPGELAVAGGVPADEGEVGGVAVLRIGDAIPASRRRRST